MNKSVRSAGSDCQVLVVGAGPAGLTLASELLAEGLSTRIIERRDGAVLQSQALAMHPRSLELFDARGIAERLIARGGPIRRMHMYVDGKRLVTMNFRHNGSWFGYGLSIPQRETELVLRDQIAELDGRVEGRTELLDFEQDEDRVSARIKSGSGEIEIVRCEYLVGCDGAHSVVRHRLGLKFDGQPYPQQWLMADVRLDWALSSEEAHSFFRSDGASLALLPLPDNWWRVVLPFAGERGTEDPTLDELQWLVDQRAPRRVTLSNPKWTTNFRCQLRSTDTYRVGRVLLAGDAAHIHSPAGGQGMNTGMQDAFNLAWKLALVVNGSSPDWLLDTYQEERLPVAEGVLHFTDDIVRMARITNPIKRTVRDIVVPLASRLPRIQRRAARRLGQLHVSYRESRLSHGDSSGDRVPDMSVRDGHGTLRLYEALRSHRHVLVAGTMAATSQLEPYREFIDVVAGKTHEAILIRPDGYIAARGSHVFDYLVEVFPSKAAVAAPELTKEVA